MAIEVAQATVSIVPNLKGAPQKITEDLGIEKIGDDSGKKLGLGIVGKLKGVFAAAAIGKVIGDTLSAGADLQQSLGGIETLFKDNADVVKNYASQAYKTAGISMNDYMENVTSFSAALIKSMDGDTAAAAELANTAMIDMADNANKMGTDMSSIQAAYQGFAKGNYTLLDNLKLGYGGTKTEMERLLADASKLSGVEYNIDNLDDVYEAIHVIQTDLGITGTTAAEAATTFSGSFASMKAAATDLMANLALGNDITPQIQALGESISTFLTGNLLPMLGNIVTQIPTILGQLPGFLAGIIPQLIPIAGQMIQGLLNGIVQNIPVFVAGLGQLVSSAFTALTGADWAGIGGSIIDALGTAFASLVDIAAGIWSSVVSVFTGGIDVKAIGTAAWDALKGIATRIWENVKKIFSVSPKVKAIATGAWNTITSTATTLWSGVKNIFEGAAPKVKAIATTAWDTLSTTASNIWNGVKEIFGSFEIEWPDFGTLASKAFDGLKNAAKSAWDWVKGLFGGGASDETVTAVQGSTTEMENALKNCNLVISEVDTGTIETANTFVTESVGNWETEVSGATLTIPTVQTSAMAVALQEVQSKVSSMKSAMNFSWSLPTLHGSLPSISVSMRSASSSDGKTTVSYPVFNVGYRWFAEGGIFNQPTVIGVGEAGAEAALPLDQFWRRLDAEFDRSGSGATINNYIEINGATDPVAYADELARELQMQLKRA